MSFLATSSNIRYYSTKIMNNKERSLMRVNGNIIPKSDTMFELGEWGQYVDIDTTPNLYRSRSYTYPNRYEYSIENKINNVQQVSNNQNMKKDILQNHPVLKILESIILPCLAYFNTKTNNINIEHENIPMLECKSQAKSLGHSIYRINEEVEEISNEEENVKMNPYHMVVISTVSFSVVYIYMLW